MIASRILTTTAVTTALMVAGGGVAVASESDAEGIEQSSVESPEVADEVPADAPSADDAAPADPVVAPAPEAPAAEEPAAEEPAAEEPADEAAADEAPAAEAPADEAPADEAPADEVPVAEEPAAAEPTVDEASDATVEAAEAAPTALSAVSTLSTTAATTAEPTVHWHDGGEDSFSCDYWYFMETGETVSGRDWSGWSGTPQLHILHHTIVDADGTTHMVYDRDIANSWYHVWGGSNQDEQGNPVFTPNAGIDEDGMHWSDTNAQQSVLVNGYKGGSDMTARAADAQRILDRAGVAIQMPEWMTEIPEQGSMSDAYYAEYLESRETERQRFLDYTAYEATQFAVWYFSTGHDVMGLFFDVDASGHVTLSQKALDQFAGQTDDDWTRTWTETNYNSDRLATMKTAAWLIEKALASNTVMPQPGFVSHGYVANKDGSTDYGFTVTLVAGTGKVHVELRTADGSAIPAGVVLVDAQGKVITDVVPGQKVYVRVPAGMDPASLPAFQLWGSAEGTEKGSPHYFTGEDSTNNNPSRYDDETGQWVQDHDQHWLIGLGELDRPSTAWDWIGISLADITDPEDPSDPTDPTEPSDPTDPTDPVEPTDPVVAPVGNEIASPTDPTNLGTSAGSVGIKVPTAATIGTATGQHVQVPSAGLAQTGSEASTIVALGSLISLAGLGMVVVRHRGRHAAS